MGGGRIVDTPPVRVVVLPAEVYASGMLLRVRVEHHAPPKPVVDQPAQALMPWPHEQWADASTARLSWPVADVDISIGVSRHDLDAAADGVAA